MRAFVPLCWLLVTAAFAQTTTPEIAPLQDPYAKNLTSIRAARVQRAAPITASYLAALERLAPQAAADPALVAAVASERERVAARRAPAEAERRAMPAALTQLRMRYEADIERSDAPFQQQEVQLTRQYISALDTLQRRLAAQNQFAKAAAVHAESTAVAAMLPKGALVRQDVGKTVAESTIRPSTAKVVGTLDPALAKKLADVAGAKNFTRTENCSGRDVSKGWADVPENGALLVGFEFFEVGKERHIRSLRPYFMTGDGIIAGKDRGIMEKVSTKIIARAGYAVAGLLTDEGKRGMQLIFMKIDSATGRFATDASSTYRSAWFGEKSREKPKQIGGDGRYVVGVYGKTGSDCDDIGLIVPN